MLIVLGLIGGYLLWTGRRGVIANNNLTFSIAGFRVHRVSVANIECVIRLSIVNASNQDYTIAKAFFIVKYPKGGLNTGAIGNTLASFESLQNLQIRARQTLQAEAKVNIPTMRLLSVIREYFTTSNKMIGEITGTITLNTNSNGINILPTDINIRESFNSVRSQIQGVLSFLSFK